MITDKLHDDKKLAQGLMVATFSYKNIKVYIKLKNNKQKFN